MYVRIKWEPEKIVVVTVEDFGTHGVQIRIDDYRVASFSGDGLLRLAEFHPQSAQGSHLSSLGMKFVSSRRTGEYVHIEALT